eukprot:TRINITY_DN11557_c0_g1_i1.p1 TRINITY_DN11557_c0_g1~~TRINITY_DN11557_c0_g1_i1.p1  ORF type:complete len:710 (+),score=87.85 TRINITY_DN11557_c0_g1_i1:2-2131(+)
MAGMLWPYLCSCLLLLRATHHAVGQSTTSASGDDYFLVSQPLPISYEVSWYREDVKINYLSLGPTPVASLAANEQILAIAKQRTADDVSVTIATLVSSRAMFQTISTHDLILNDRDDFSQPIILLGGARFLGLQQRSSLRIYNIDDWFQPSQSIVSPTKVFAAPSLKQAVLSVGYAWLLFESSFCVYTLKDFELAANKSVTSLINDTVEKTETFASFVLTGPASALVWLSSDSILQLDVDRNGFAAPTSVPVLVDTDYVVARKMMVNDHLLALQTVQYISADGALAAFTRLYDVNPPYCYLGTHVQLGLETNPMSFPLLTGTSLLLGYDLVRVASQTNSSAWLVSPCAMTAIEAKQQPACDTVAPMDMVDDLFGCPRPLVSSSTPSSDPSTTPLPTTEAADIEANRLSPGVRVWNPTLIIISSILGTALAVVTSGLLVYRRLYRQGKVDFWTDEDILLPTDKYEHVNDERPGKDIELRTGPAGTGSDGVGDESASIHSFELSRNGQAELDVLSAYMNNYDVMGLESCWGCLEHLDATECYAVEQALMIAAVKHDWLPGVRFMLTKTKPGVWLTLDDRGYSALHWAVLCAHPAVVTTMVEAFRPCLALATKDGDNLLHLLVREDRTEVLEQLYHLLGHELSPFISEPNNQMQTPMELAQSLQSRCWPLLQAYIAADHRFATKPWTNFTLWRNAIHVRRNKCLKGMWLVAS